MQVNYKRAPEHFGELDTPRAVVVPPAVDREDAMSFQFSEPKALLGMNIGLSCICTIISPPAQAPTGHNETYITGVSRRVCVGQFK